MIAAPLTPQQQADADAFWNLLGAYGADGVDRMSRTMEQVPDGGPLLDALLVALGRVDDRLALVVAPSTNAGGVTPTPQITISANTRPEAFGVVFAIVDRAPRHVRDQIDIRALQQRREPDSLDATTLTPQFPGGHDLPVRDILWTVKKVLPATRQAHLHVYIPGWEPSLPTDHPHNAAREAACWQIVDHALGEYVAVIIDDLDCHHPDTAPPEARPISTLAAAIDELFPDGPAL